MTMKKVVEFFFVIVILENEVYNVMKEERQNFSHR